MCLWLHILRMVLHLVHKCTISYKYCLSIQRINWKSNTSVEDEKKPVNRLWQFVALSLCPFLIAPRWWGSMAMQENHPAIRKTTKCEKFITILEWISGSGYWSLIQIIFSSFLNSLFSYLLHCFKQNSYAWGRPLKFPWLAPMWELGNMHSSHVIRETARGVQLSHDSLHMFDQWVVQLALLTSWIQSYCAYLL